MRTILTPFISMLFLFIILNFGCSNSINTIGNNLELLDKIELSNETMLYKYKYNFIGNAWMDISVYLKRKNLNYIISINEPDEYSMNNYLYDPNLDEQNLIISNRVRKETANSLEDAVKKAILFYLSDNI